MDFKQLEAFQALLKHGTCSNAAKSLYISQPTMTVRMQSLEQELGVKLFKRCRREFKLTIEGTIFTNYAHDILNLQAKSLKAMKEIKGLSSGTIKIGTTSFGTYIFPAITKKFQEAFPGIRLSLSINNTSIVMSEIFEETIDIAVIASSTERKELYSLTVGQDSLVLVAGSNMPIFHKRKVTISDLFHERFLIREQGSDTRRLFDDWCHSNNFYPNNFMEMSQPEAIRRAVENNLGISIMSKFILQNNSENPNIKILLTEGFPIYRPIRILMLNKNKDDVLNQTLAKFVENYLS